MGNLISLSKGETINLSKMPMIDISKGGRGLSNVIVGLGWDPVSARSNQQDATGKRKGIFGVFGDKPKPAVKNETIDCDAFAMLLNSNNVLKSREDLIYFGHLTHATNSVVHQGDNLTGDGDGDDEQISVNLMTVPTDVVMVGVNIYSGLSKKQDFSMLENAYIRVVDTTTSTELCRYTLDSQYAGAVSLLFGKFVKQNGEWTFVALGEVINRPSISDIAFQFMN